MIPEITIERFRGISRLEAKRLRDVNLILGRNNCGKTSFLEALRLLCAGTEPTSILDLAAIRGQRALWESWRNRHPLIRHFHAPAALESALFSFFYQLDPSCPIKIQSFLKLLPQAKKTKRTLTISVPEEDVVYSEEDSLSGIVSTERSPLANGIQVDLQHNGKRATLLLHIRRRNRVAPRLRGDDVETIPSYLLSARHINIDDDLAERVGRLLREKRKEEIVSCLKLIDNRICDIDTIFESGQVAIYLDIGSGSLLPATVSGEGTIRILSMLVHLLTLENGGVLLIDEIDNGIHYSVMKKFWEVIAELTRRFQVQLFATTHNKDILDSAIEWFSEHEPNRLGVFRIDREEGKEEGVEDIFNFVDYDPELQEYIRKHDVEVRG